MDPKRKKRRKPDRDKIEAEVWARFNAYREQIGLEPLERLRPRKSRER